MCAAAALQCAAAALQSAKRSRCLLRHEAVQLDDALTQGWSGGAAFGYCRESPGGGEGATEARRGREREEYVRLPAAALQCVRRSCCGTLLQAAVQLGDARAQGWLELYAAAICCDRESRGDGKVAAGARR